MKTIAQRLIDYRQEQRVTQKQLAALIGVCSKTLSGWEHGKIPNAEMRFILSDLFGCEPEELEAETK